VQVFKHQYDLASIESCIGRLKSAFGSQVREQLSTAYVFKKKIEILQVLIKALETNKEGVVNISQYSIFTYYMINLL